MNQKLINFAATFLLLTALPCAALSTDADQPIYIDSDSQQLDLNTNTVIFTGNVLLKQGSIKLTADKVVVKRPQGKNGKEVIDAFGKPAKFQQQMDDGKMIYGEALTVEYDVARSFLTITQQAVLTQEGGNKVEGQQITYNIAKQLLVARSGEKNRVTTVLQPQKKSEKK